MWIRGLILLIFCFASMGERLEAQAGKYLKQSHSSTLTLAKLKQQSYSLKEEQSSQKLTFKPVELSNGTQITFISPEQWRSLIRILENKTKESHKKFERLFGQLPSFKTTVRLMSEGDFFEHTGAPPWTNAMYYRGEIIIPISNSSEIDYQNMFRSLRHEYSHAVTNALSKGRCPGWLDEGIAQWSEGIVNPALEPALHDWLENNPPLDLAALRGGFTKLDTGMVPAAYAQSLFASTTLIKSFGFKQVRLYFDNLAQGQEDSLAFSKAFDINSMKFENVLSAKLDKWHSGVNDKPSSLAYSIIRYTDADH